MSKNKLIFASLLILITFSTLFIISIPSIYSENKAGKIEKEIITNFDFLQKEEKNYVLLYFGFVGCTTICPPALNEISEIYEKLDKTKFSFYFVNLQENTPPENVELFVKVFHPDFKGVYLDKENITKTISKLNVKYAKALFDKNDIEHSGFLYFLEKENNLFVQKYIYTTKPFAIDLIANELNKIEKGK